MSRWVDKIVKYKENVYYVESVVKMRHPYTGAWLDAYLYISADDSQAAYVREVTDFESKFVLVDDDEDDA